jgi:hypothetical protein
LLSKYSVIDEDNSSSIDLPESAAVSTWNSIGLERPMVIAMVRVTQMKMTSSLILLSSFALLFFSSACQWHGEWLGWIASKREVVYRQYDYQISEMDWVRS